MSCHKSSEPSIFIGRENLTAEIQVSPSLCDRVGSVHVAVSDDAENAQIAESAVAWQVEACMLQAHEVTPLGIQRAMQLQYIGRSNIELLRGFGRVFPLQANKPASYTFRNKGEGVQQPFV